tara:strand:- start:1352 stop:1660 length:309 start_codon:yes stop_codon:yes gene_type:complete
MGCTGCGGSVSNKGSVTKRKNSSTNSKRTPWRTKSVNPIVGVAQRLKDKLVAKQPLRTKRMDICKSCEFYDEILVRCKDCGCFLKPKVLLKESVCPLEEPKW